MKKLIIIVTLLFGSVNLMADYVAGFLSCKHPDDNGKSSYFIVKGVGADLSSLGNRLAMANFLNGEYASETYSYCKLKKIYTDGSVFSYSTKSKANKKFSSLINEFKGQSFVSKLITVSRGYDAGDWE